MTAADRRHRQAGARRVPAGRGPGLPLRRRPAAERRLAAAHRRCRQGAWRRSSWRRRACEYCTTVVGLQHAQRRDEHLQRLLLRHPQALGRAQEPRGEVRGHHGAPEPAAGQASRRAWPSPSRRRPSRASAPRAASPSSSRTGPARTSSSWRQNTQKFMAEARKRPEIARVTTTFLPTVPQIFVDVDRDKALKQGVDLHRRLRHAAGLHGRRTSSTTSTASAGSGRSTCRPKATTARGAEQLGQFYVRNSEGNMVPLSALTSIEQRSGPGVHHALQPLPLRPDQRRRRARATARPRP